MVAEAIEGLNSVRVSAACTVILHILQNVGRPGRVPGTYELVILKTPFIVSYRAARAVDYSRRRAANQRYSLDETELHEIEMMDFILSHGQSLDRVVDMIATLAMDKILRD